jgi:hypothetical protein
VDVGKQRLERVVDNPIDTEGCGQMQADVGLRMQRSTSSASRTLPSTNRTRSPWLAAWAGFPSRLADDPHCPQNAHSGFMSGSFRNKNRYLRPLTDGDSK